MEQLTEILNFEFFFIYFILQFLIIYLTRLRAKRFKNLDIKLIKNTQHQNVVKNMKTIVVSQDIIEKAKTMDFDESLSIMELITELEADYLLKKINKEDFETVSTDLKRKYLKITENKA